MLHKKLILVALVFLGINLKEYAQQAIPTTGGNASGSGGSMNYSIGQIMYTTNTGTNGSVAQGVQQPFEISVVSGIDKAFDITLQCSAYPNPTNDFLTLKFENISSANLTYQLYDISGKLLESKRVDGNETTIVMNNLSPATYFLKVIQGSRKIKTFKIVKN